MERSKKITIGEKSFLIKFPNVGQIIDMDSMKQALSSNRYGTMAASGVQSAYYALDIIDMISFYSIVCPEIGKYYNISNYASMELDKIQELLKAYIEEVRPWYNSTLQELKDFDKKSDNDNGANSTE